MQETNTEVSIGDLSPTGILSGLPCGTCFGAVVVSSSPGLKICCHISLLFSGAMIFLPVGRSLHKKSLHVVDTELVEVLRLFSPRPDKDMKDRSFKNKMLEANLAQQCFQSLRREAGLVKVQIVSLLPVENIHRADVAILDVAVLAGQNSLSRPLQVRHDQAELAVLSLSPWPIPLMSLRSVLAGHASSMCDE